MFRLILCITLEAILFILFIPFTGLALLIGLFNKNIQYKIGAVITGCAAAIFYKINGAELTVVGREHIPKKETVLFVGNHRSFIDIPLLLAYSKKDIGFVAKHTLKKTPILNIWMFLIGCLFLDRTNLRKGAKTIKEGINLLKAGHSLVIFPEGTRGYSESMLPFKQGSMKLALKANVRVVPFAISGTGEIYEDNGYRFKKGPVKLSFGPPMDLSLLDKEAQKNCATDVQEVIGQLLNEMKA